MCGGNGAWTTCDIGGDAGECIVTVPGTASVLQPEDQDLEQHRAPPLNSSRDMVDADANCKELRLVLVVLRWQAISEPAQLVL